MSYLETIPEFKHDLLKLQKTHQLSLNKNQILLEVAKSIKKEVNEIIKANEEDVKNAKKNGLDDAKIDRLILDEKRIFSLADAIEDIVKLADPVGKILYDVDRDNGLNIKRITTPIGVLLAIYESRPNVTSDIEIGRAHV